MNITEEKLNSFIERASVLRNTDNSLDFEDPKGKKHIMDYVSFGKYRLSIILFIHKLFGYTIKNVDETQLQKILTRRNLALSMSLKKRFPNTKMKILRFQKHNKLNQLLKFRFIILIQDENNNYQGLETTIL